MLMTLSLVISLVIRSNIRSLVLWFFGLPHVVDATGVSIGRGRRCDERFYGRVSEGLGLFGF
jgi:hypothetical protein